MSSLIAHTESKQALIATDTLAVTPDGVPFLFTTKALYVPHLRLVIAATGAGGFLDQWFLRLNTGMLVAGVEMLHQHVPGQLQRLWTEYQRAQAPDPNVTVTVYHFGVSEATSEIVTYAYRSSSGFAGELLTAGLLYKPRMTVREGYRLPDEILSMMEEQRSIQAALPHGQRVYIGGEIIAHHLTPDGCQIYSCAHFPDHAEDFKEALSRLS